MIGLWIFLDIGELDEYSCNYKVNIKIAGLLLEGINFF